MASCVFGGRAPETEPTESTVGALNPTPVHQVRIRMIRAAGASMTDAAATQIINEANSVLASAGISLVFNPTTDLITGAATLQCPTIQTIGGLPVCAGGDDNTLTADGDRHVGVVPVYVCPCGGGASSGIGNSVRIETPYHGLGLAHELGHYFGLAHVHTDGRNHITVVQHIRDKMTAYYAPSPVPAIIPANVKALGAVWRDEFFDGEDCTDHTPPIPSAGCLISDTAPTTDAAPPGNWCSNSYVVPLSVTFSGGDTGYYDFTPARDNPMSYYGPCSLWTDRYSAQQAAVMRDKLVNGNRRHLLGPPLRWGNWSQVAGGTSQGLGSAAFNGLLYLFAAGGPQDQYVYGNVASPGQPFSGWSYLGGATAAPIAATPFDGRLYLFARGSGQDTSIYANVALPGQSWSGWSGLGGNTDIALSATAFDNRLYAFSKNINNHGIDVNIAEPQQAFSGWQAIGGQTDTPIAATTFDNKLYLITRAYGSNQYYVNVALPQQAFGGWTAIPSQLASGIVPTGAMAITSFGGRLFAVARGTNNRIYFNSALPSQAFGHWLEVPGAMTTDAAPTVTVFDSRLQIAVKGTSNSIHIISAELLTP